MITRSRLWIVRCDEGNGLDRSCGNRPAHLVSGQQRIARRPGAAHRGAASLDAESQNFLTADPLDPEDNRRTTMPLRESFGTRPEEPWLPTGRVYRIPR